MPVGSKRRRGRPGGPSNGAVLSQAEVAAMLGISKQAVYEAEDRAFRKIRQALFFDRAFRQAVSEATGLSFEELDRG